MAVILNVARMRLFGHVVFSIGACNASGGRPLCTSPIQNLFGHIVEVLQMPSSLLQSCLPSYFEQQVIDVQVASKQRFADFVKLIYNHATEVDAFMRDNDPTAWMNEKKALHEQLSTMNNVKIQAFVKSLALRKRVSCLPVFPRVQMRLSEASSVCNMHCACVCTPENAKAKQHGQSINVEASFNVFPDEKKRVIADILDRIEKCSHSAEGQAIALLSVSSIMPDFLKHIMGMVGDEVMPKQEKSGGDEEKETLATVHVQKGMPIHKWAGDVKQAELNDDHGFDEELTLAQKSWLISYLQHNHYSFSGYHDESSADCYGTGIDKLSIKVTDSK